MPTAALFILQEYFCDHSKDKYTDMLRESLKTLVNLKKFFVFFKKAWYTRKDDLCIFFMA